MDPKTAQKLMDPKTARKLENARINMKISVALSDLSAAEISTRAGLSINVLGKYMRNETMISFGNMQAVCDTLNIPISLITSDQQITPARIRLVKVIDRMNDSELSLFLEKEKGRE